jgi:DNA replication protein DnaC
MPCPLCDDTGWKPVEEQGVRRVVRCDCWRAQVGRNRLADANIPRRYQHCTLANFTAYNESLEKAVARAQRVADAFPVVNQGPAARRPARCRQDASRRRRPEAGD